MMHSVPAPAPPSPPLAAPTGSAAPAGSAGSVRPLRTCLVVAAALLLPAAARAAELEDLVAGEVARVADGFTFTEGPAWHPDGYLLFSDIPSNRIIRVDADGSVSDWMTDSDGANGLMCDRRGDVYACQGGAQRVARLRGGRVRQVLAAEFNGRSFNRPNDLALDERGGLYFTDPMYGRGEPVQPVQGVYYVSAAGRVSRVIDDLPRPNGILVSPDGGSLYVANPNVREIVRYRIAGPGQLTDRRVIFTGDEQQDGNGPDGMAFDERGNLYATYKTLVVLDADGELAGRVAVPEKPSNCAFGGADNRTLYITARTSLYSLPMKVSGMVLQPAGPGSEPAALFEEKTSETQAVRARDLTLNVPKSWKGEPPSTRLRLAQFVVPAADDDREDAAFVVFPPFGGSAAANIARWVGQFDSEGREVRMTRGKAEQGDYILVDISGTYNRTVGPPIRRQTERKPGFRVINAMFSAKSGGNYFFKLEGPKATVSAAADAFRRTFGGDAGKESEYTPEE